MRIRGWRATSARMRGQGLRVGLALAVGVMLAFLSLLPVGPLGRTLPVASAHALLVRSDPKANAILQAPPAAVHAWFSEDLNPLTSKIVVVDPANREVDRGDSHVESSNSKEMEVSLPLLPAGTYIVVWRAQSADDGHVSGSSFIFRIAKADGSVPPIPAVLPTGHFAGGAGIGTPGGATLDGPTVFQAISTWLALLFMTFWVGGVFWETWILNPHDGGRDPDLLAAAQRSSARFARFAPYALGGVLLADIGMIIGQALELSGGISPAVLSAILFGSRFGAFWWLRQGVALAALILALAVARGLLPNRAGTSTAGAAATDLDDDVGSIPDWRRELVNTLRGVPRLPARVVAGVRAQSGAGRLACALAGLLLIAFALSGHAAAVPANTFIYAIAVDLLHLFFEATWIGGLF
ncbi:MAG TPA: copper resistance CopC family protein, partial [Ktedonobacterales bacterium]|nr:copper resistance CopC family protein [Ktedonobacterales bacterium]